MSVTLISLWLVWPVGLSLVAFGRAKVALARKRFQPTTKTVESEPVSRFSSPVKSSTPSPISTTPDARISNSELRLSMPTLLAPRTAASPESRNGTPSPRE